MLFKTRLFFEEIIEETLSFSKKLVWDTSSNHLYLARSAEELVEVFKLRSDIYTGLNYNKEFPDPIDGLNFDHYDPHSAIVYNKVNNELTGTCRFIFDSPIKLPIEEKFSFDYMRERHGAIGEVSRLMVKHKEAGHNLEFKNLTKGIYSILMKNSVDASISVISKEHFKLYSKFGGFKIEKELSSYGTLQAPFVLTSWNPREISDFFEKLFLKS